MVGAMEVIRLVALRAFQGFRPLCRPVVLPRLVVVASRLQGVVPAEIRIPVVVGLAASPPISKDEEVRFTGTFDNPVPAFAIG